MYDIFALILNALVQTVTFGLGAIGVGIAFRIVKYPDLTADGSFLIGLATSAAVLTSGYSWILAAITGMFAGSVAGLTTSLLNSHFGVNRLLSGVLTTMIAYSLGFRALGGRPNIAYSSDVPTVFTVLAPLKPIVGPIISDLITGAICTLVVSVGIWVLFSSEVGLVIRAAGTNATLLKHMGHQSSLYQALGLAASNGLVALSAVLVSAREGYADIGSGIGIVVTLIASLVLGEQLIGTVRSTSVKRIAGPLIGTFAYYLLFLIVLRASLRGWIPFQIYPTDLRLMSAVVLVISLVLRGAKSRAPQTEEIIPL